MPPILQLLSKFFPACYVLPEFSSSASPCPRDHTAVKIVHAGGIAEYYYRAVPASRIMEKYPSFILTRPTIFRRPWESLVRPDETLTPGEKYYVVPRGTVRKLQRRIRRHAGEVPLESLSGQSVADGSMSGKSVSISKRHKDQTPTKSCRLRTRNNQTVKADADRRKVRPQAAAAASASKTRPSVSNAKTNGSILSQYSSKISIKSARQPTKDHRSGKANMDPCSSRSSDSMPTPKVASSTKSSDKKCAAPDANRRVLNSGTWSPSLPTISEVSPS